MLCYRINISFLIIYLIINELYEKLILIKLKNSLIIIEENKLILFL